MEFQMNFCRFVTTCTILTVSANFLVFRYYKKHNLRKKLFLGFMIYAVTEPLILTAGVIPVLLDPTLSRSEISELKIEKNQNEKEKLS